MAKGTTVERTEDRYELTGNQAVVVTIEPDDYRGEAVTSTAKLLNLSTSGAKLSVPLDLPTNKSIRIKLTLEEFSLTIYVAGTVCWTAKESEQSSLIGCRLNPQIPASILQHIAQQGRLDRRDEDRRPTERQVEITRVRRFGRSTVEQGELRNFAAGGVCLETSQPAALGDLLRVRLSDCDVTFDVNVRWQIEQDDRCVIGCEYVDAGSFSALRRAVEA